MGRCNSLIGDRMLILLRQRAKDLDSRFGSASSCLGSLAGQRPYPPWSARHYRTAIQQLSSATTYADHALLIAHRYIHLLWYIHASLFTMQGPFQEFGDFGEFFSPLPCPLRHL